MMEVFIARPIEVEARQWDGSQQDATLLIHWVGRNNGVARFENTGYIYLLTKDRGIIVKPHNWTVFVYGEFYTYTNEIFEKMYTR